MHQCLVQWDGDEVEVVRADDSSEVSLVDMNDWDAEGQEPISGIALEDCDRIEATKKRAEAGLIHWPHRVKTSWQVTKSSKIREAGPSDRPQKMSNIYFRLQLLHYVQTMTFAEHSVLNNNRNVGTASPCG